MELGVASTVRIIPVISLSQTSKMSVECRGRGHPRDNRLLHIPLDPYKCSLT